MINLYNTCYILYELIITVDFEGVEDLEVARGVLRKYGHHLEKFLEADAVVVAVVYLAWIQTSASEHLAYAVPEWVFLNRNVCD